MSHPRSRELTAALVAAGVVIGVGAAAAYAFRMSSAGTAQMWLGIGIPYAALSIVGLMRLRRMQLLGQVFQFKRGDPSLGILIGLVLIGGAWLVARTFLPPGTPERAWMLRVFLLPGQISGVAVSLVLLAVTVAEEIVWRGWVQSELREWLGARRCWIVSAALYAAAHLPTLFTLEDAAAGKNPLLVIAALGCGLCFGFLAERTGRLVPGLFAHGVFTYFTATSFWLFV